MPIETVMTLLSLVGTLVGSLSGVLISNKMTNYRIEQLEKKVDKHNGVLERTTVVEQSLKAAWKRVDEHTVKIEKLEG